MKIKLFVVLLFLSINVHGQDVARGESLYKTCVQCHGDNAQGLEAELAPKLKGQFDWYIEASLEAFKSGKRKNPKMLPFIKELSSKDFKDLAAYIAQLK